MDTSPFNGKKPLIYVTREIERALGIEPSGDYFIIANRSPYAITLQERYPENILLIDSATPLDTYELLNISEVSAAITEADADLLVFKNTPRIEAYAREKKWNLLNPPARLAATIEHKLEQVSWLGPLAVHLPPHSIQTVKDIIWGGKPFIVQWGHSHTGDGTLFIKNQSDLLAIQKKFPERAARVCEYIEGPVFTSNCIVTKTEMLFGTISYQITGIPPFTESQFSTIGNDWALPSKIIPPEILEEYWELATRISKHMAESGWKGLFGIDVLYCPSRKKLYLIEINARQPASTTYESQLQESIRSYSTQDTSRITTFEAHLMALRNESFKESTLIQIHDGAQIIQRVTTAINLKTLPLDVPLNTNDVAYIRYSNTKNNADFLRIQTHSHFMESDGALNQYGQSVAQTISQALTS